MKSGPIYVTRPDLPPLEDLVLLLEKVWDSRILTNGGPCHHQLEQALCEHLRQRLTHRSSYTPTSTRAPTKS
jgi:hypothetical protein